MNIYLTLFTVLLLFASPLDAVFADVGNSVSHNEPSGGGGDFGGDGSEIWFIILLLKDNPLLLIIVLVAYFIFRGKFRKGTRSNQHSNRRNNGNIGHTINRTLGGALNDVLKQSGVGSSQSMSLQTLKEKDPQFSDEVFLSKVNNMFIQLQQAWMEKKWSSIRPFETDELFNMHNIQLNSYVEKHQTNVVENIAILDSKIIRYENDGAHDKIDVSIRARMNDYVIDDQTEKLIRGNPNRDIYMTYVWTLIRKDTVKTESNKEQYSVTQCPNCGANVSINASGQCDYCESVISNGDYDWVLSKIKVVSQE